MATATLVPTQNAQLVSWVDEMARMCKPDSVYWCDGSDNERDRLTAEAVDAWLGGGAHAVVMGTAAVRDPLLLQRCAHLSKSSLADERVWRGRLKLTEQEGSRHGEGVEDI